jgi:hypothetical protein
MVLEESRLGQTRVFSALTEAWGGFYLLGLVSILVGQRSKNIDG